MITITFLKQNRTLIGSFVVFLSVVMIFKFSQSSVNISSLFSRTKPGIITFQHDPAYPINQPFKLSINLNTNNQKVNAVGVYLRFNTSQLQLLDLDTRKSFCQFYPEKKFDNNLGTVSLACGSPHPGVSGENNLMILEFIPLVAGTTSIQLDPNSKILLSNGKGTNVLSEFPIAQFNLITNL